AVCGYMAGLIGASNSPISGVGILSVLGISLILVALFPHEGGDATKALVAFALFVTAIIFGVATISNNNLQDLKTGQLVDATPWKQQVALVIGVIAGSLVIPPVLDLMNHTYGFAGAPDADPTRALPAPQAGLISALAKGVIAADIDWSLIGIGALIGVGIVLLDEILARTTKHMRVPPLAVGLGIYLPTSSTLMIIVGAVVGWFYDRRADRTPRPEASKQLGILLASGLIVGEGVIAVVISLIKAFSSKPAPLALVGPDGLLTKWIPIFANFGTVGILVGGITFAAIAFLLYRWILRMGSTRAT
ncbi:MAG TPA: oligopeptide transporter, OPT family, partial [Tepidisphaeraceae bacterium]|nr:oligopeptide transporter, OPT family [Tepidisphaeraceae bacterium]